MRIWSCLLAPSVSAAVKKTAVLVFLISLLSFSLEAQKLWKIQFFYDKQDSSFDIRDIQCASPERCVAVGVIAQKDGGQKGAMVSTNDGGLHWSMAEVKEDPVSLFFLNDSRGWMATERGIWMSDAGEPTWKKLAGLKGIARVYFLDSMHGFAIGSPRAIYETADGGKKWTKAPAANIPSADPKRTVFRSIAFRGQHGLVVGEVLPEDPETPFLSPLSITLGRRSTIVWLETLDGGKSWTSHTGSFFGSITQAGFTKEGVPIFLLESSIASGASSVLEGPLGSDAQRTVFAEKNRVLTGFALLGEGGALLAAIEPPGNSSQIPIPGKLKMLESSDLKTWREMNVDYRAVAQRAVVAAVDSGHQWVATDTGMILGLAEGKTAQLDQKARTGSAGRVLSTPSPQ